MSASDSNRSSNPRTPSDDLQHIQFEGCDVCIIAPEDYDRQRAEVEQLRTLLRIARDEWYDDNGQWGDGFGLKHWTRKADALLSGESSAHETSNDDDDREEIAHGDYRYYAPKASDLPWCCICNTRHALGTACPTEKAAAKSRDLQSLCDRLNEVFDVTPEGDVPDPLCQEAREAIEELWEGRDQPTYQRAAKLFRDGFMAGIAEAESKTKERPKDGPGSILGCTCIMCEYHRSAEDIERKRRAEAGESPCGE